MSSEYTRKALQLYREILQLHSVKLPVPMKSIGQCSKAQFQQFLSAWRGYADMVKSQPVVKGKDLTPEQKRLLSEKQLDQLEELEKATSEL
jgi:hypothetical protein